MRFQIESLLRVIAVCFICVGTIQFAQDAFDIPFQRLGRMMLPAPYEGIIRELNASTAVTLIGRAVPAVVGALLIVFRGRIATIVGPEEAWPLILGRVVIVVGVAMVTCDLLYGVFSHAGMAVRSNQVFLRASLWFGIIHNSVSYLTLGLIWLLTRRLTTTCTNHAVEPTTKA